MTEVRRLVASDAPALVACFRRCYGGTYPSDDFYDASRLVQRITSGSLRSVVAVAADGTLVGHTGLTVRHAGANAIEAGNTVVDPACRGQGLLGRMAAALHELCLESGYVAYLHYPTTAHDIMQKSSVRGSGIETGVMLDYIPAETEYRAIDRDVGRLAATVVYQPFTAAPAREVWIPGAYRDLVAELYRAAGLERTLYVSDGAVEAQRTDATIAFATRRSLLSLHVTTAGPDLDDIVTTAHAVHAGAVAHVDLCMDDPGIGSAVAALRHAGYFFCALMPEFAHTDVLRMQRLNERGATAFSPRLANSGAARLLERMREEAGFIP